MMDPDAVREDSGPLTVRDLDAAFSITRTRERTFIHLESRGGPDRNTDYLLAFEALLEMLGGLDALLLDVLLDSRRTEELSEAERRVDPDPYGPYPVSLSRIDSVGSFRRALTRSVATTARASDSTGGGNPTKRLRLEVHVPGNPSVDDLADSLAHTSTETLPAEFAFKPQPPRAKTEGTVRRGVGKTWVESMHARMQLSLYKILVKKHGEAAVSAEALTASGRPADLVVATSEGYVIYEIKTAPTAKDCVRQALGQILEYGYWPGSPRVSDLCIVGAAVGDEPTRQFLQDLRARFDLPVRYVQHLPAEIE